MDARKGFRETTDPRELAKYKAFLLSKILVDQGDDKAVPYEPHDGQMQVHFPDTPWRYICLSWGRRTGKTLSAAIEIVYELGLPKTRTWIVAPNYELTDRVFDYVYEWVVRQRIFGSGSVKKASRTKDQRYIEMAWGSFVRGKSADSPDSLVGDQLDLVVFDECARCTEHIWTENLEPTTIDRKGRVMFISTPRGYNWFQDYFERGLTQDTIDKGWKSIQMRTIDNPHHDEEWVVSKRAETPTDVWEQEYEGKFTSYSGLVWPDYKDHIYPDGHLFDPSEYDFSSNYTIYRAIDVGWRHPTACLWLAVDRESNVYLFREYEKQNVVHEVHAQAINALSAEPVACTWISPDAARRNPLTASESHKLSALDIYRRAGIYALPASNSVNPGISEVARYLRSTREVKSAHPRVLISKELLGLRKSLRSYVFQEVQSKRDIDAPDKPRKYKDDLVDAFRYALAAKPRFQAFWLEDEYIEPPSQPRASGMATVPYYG